MARRPNWLPPPETIIEDMLRATSDRRTRAGPHTLDWNQNISEGHKRRLKERMAKTWEARQAATPKQQTVVDRFLAQMEPGRWYGLRNVARAAGLNPKVAHPVELTLRNKGLAERESNPEWIPHAGAHGRTKGPIPPGLTLEPKWLYRLTAAGEAKRKALAV